MTLFIDPTVAKFVKLFILYLLNVDQTGMKMGFISDA